MTHPGFEKRADLTFTFAEIGRMHTLNNSVLSHSVRTRDQCRFFGTVFAR